jgi:FkbM family methyltransferase
MTKKIIEKSLDKLLKFRSFQDYINFRYNRKGYQAVNEKFLENLWYEYNGFKLAVNDQLESLEEVINDYNFSDIRETDIVLDIGANIGAFTMLASKKAKWVYSVEPLYTDILYKNLKINYVENVTVLELGLGEQGNINITYRRIGKTVHCYSLSDIIAMCGDHVDFLKIDCEGGEWTIKPHELKNIRRIEAEVHNFDTKNNKHDIKNFIQMLKDVGFDYTIKQAGDKDFSLISAWAIGL